MSDFEIIDKEYLNTRRVNVEEPEKKIAVDFMIKKHIVKSENAGNYVLIGIAIFFVLMSVLAFYIL